MLSVFGYVIIIIALALLYDFFNGANDSANSIATVIATKALTPLKALALASLLNLTGAFAITAVARLLEKGLFHYQSWNRRLHSWFLSVVYLVR